jgi:hypothetical protein
VNRTAPLGGATRLSLSKSSPLSEVKGIFEELDGWIRRRLRLIIWRQWNRACARAKGLMKRGLGESRAWESAANGRGPWWNSGASHIPLTHEDLSFLTQSVKLKS